MCDGHEKRALCRCQRRGSWNVGEKKEIGRGGVEGEGDGENVTYLAEVPTTMPISSSLCSPSIVSRVVSLIFAARSSGERAFSVAKVLAARASFPTSKEVHSLTLPAPSIHMAGF